MVEDLRTLELVSRGRGMAKDSQALNGKRFAELMKWHQRHIGLYARVANKTGLTPSYVSFVARGIRRNVEIEAVLTQELEHLLNIAPK